MAEGLTAGDWFGSAIIRKLVDDACFIEEAGHFHPEIQVMLRKLQSTLGGIHSWISDAERGLIRGPAESILRMELGDAFYEADDLLDEFHLRILSMKMNGGRKVRRMLSFFMHNSKTLVSFRDDLRNLKNLEGELEGISAFAKHSLVLVHNNEKQITDFRRISTSFQPNKIIGREKETEEIVSILLSSGGRDKGRAGSSSGPLIDVLPLVGMAGLGKTTLAQLVHNDERVKMHFNVRAWCYVSDDFNIQRISKELLSFLSYDLSGTISDLETSTISDLETTIMKLRLALSNRKFLIVLDDVWNEDVSKWEMLHKILICGATGSKVLVTTQSASVARIMGTMSPIMVRCLSEDECRALFELRAFGDGKLQDEERKELRYIGTQICRKLGGLPLAAKVLGSGLELLDENYWRTILRSELWEHDFVSEGVFSTLKLSYRQLNADLRQCFSYCSIFPRGYMFEKHKLVQMWLAQGYIKLGNQEGRILEDIGSAWFDELVHRSFFQPAEGNRYVMHDLMHDLAVSISLDDIFGVEDGLENIPYRFYHLVVRTNKLDVLKARRKSERLRTLLFFGDYDSREFSKVLEDMLIYLKGLRVLDLSSTPIKKLPDSFGDLSHLRYLDISNTKIRLLPTSFSRLCHLQVLNLQGCHFQELPKGMNKLINLRYLYGGSDIVSLIEGIGQLTNLHCLEEFPVRQKRGHGIGELENLKNLQGRLSIENLENVKTQEEAMKAELKNKMHLNALQLEWSSPTRNQPDVENEVLEGLEPHPNLKELIITGYNGLFCPHWMLQNLWLINLVCIHLRHCHGWEELPSFGQLPFLRILHFEDLPALTRIVGWVDRNVDVVFPSLEQLTFLELQNLKMWLGEDTHPFFPCLRKVQIKGCFSLTKWPFLSIHSPVEELVIGGCGDLGNALPECLQSFTTLTLLVISHYHHETSISLSNLNALGKLHLEDCPKLSIPGGFGSLANLKKLHIEGCPMLNDSSLPKQPDMEKGLQSLTDLCIDDSILLNDGWVLLGSLCSLRILNFQHFKHLGYFSKEQELWFHQLTTIQELGISNCHNLECLPAELSTILSLKKLSITNCPKIMSLPEKGLPISLEELQISGCPALKERYSRDVGPGWPKIAHIPFITIHA